MPHLTNADDNNNNAANNTDSKDSRKAHGNNKQSISISPSLVLIAVFVFWKIFLFAIAAGSYVVGDAYDTSGSLALLGTGSGPNLGKNSTGIHSLTLAGRLTARLTSWDAIYFVSVAHRGYRFEQEWAFGTGLPLTIRAIVQALTRLGFLGQQHAALGFHGGEGGDVALTNGQLLPEVMVGVVIANTAHLLSVLVLFRLGLLIWRDQTFALVAALLHVLSPAGLFLSAPYAESLCSLLSFTGYLLYAKSCRVSDEASSPAAAAGGFRGDAYVVLAGVAFGLATAFRSNAILNGIPFAWEMVQLLLALLLRRPSDTVLPLARRLLALGVGGVCVAAGSLVPQAVAYLRFCSLASGASGSAVDPPPWCHAYPPSIYTFVQKHYWNTGFLRYWNLPNVPLFLLAAPMIVVLTKSGLDQFLSLSPLPARSLPAVGPRKLSTSEKTAADALHSARLTTLVRSAAAAQLVLAVLAVLMYHVQIITRISSSYPLWYWWLAGALMRGDKAGSRTVMFMVIYAAVQGALFTSFLPPA
ncbi:glycosyltransferase family 76 protein [Lasiosphaeria ovina]|uniref:GPI mannosyltransferase 2 n=1 Tax=Lasiosphaeria ovina TaxID=92902 RepID=A0AAE0NMQ8_9PEZI|nr:glycosyltransferase family 76 protein [Lasiosphaeria ovina]